MSNTYRKKRLKKPFRVLIIVIIILAAVYILAVNFLLSAALIPRFQARLDFVDEITDQSFGELVESEEVDRQVDKSSDLTQNWLDQVQSEKLEKVSQDGYRLVAEVFTPDRELSYAFWQEHKLAALPDLDTFTEMCQNNEHTWVLLLHGYTGWKEELYPYACWYSIFGCHVLSPDMRCQGESEGDFIGMGYTDSQDNMLWIEEILARDPDAHIILHGQSMGSACALMMSGRDDLPGSVRGVISDCAYTDAYTMFGNRLEAWFHLPQETVIPAANLMLQLRGGYDLKDASALDAVKKSDIPTIFFHGDQDMMIPVGMAYELYDAKAGEKQLYIIEGAGHAQASVIAPDLYWKTIRDAMYEWTK